MAQRVSAQVARYLESAMPLDIRRQPARGILSRTSGFIAEAGFSHSLTPARNCTFGCLYCYVPTLRVQGGLRPEDWRQWGQFTTFKSNAAELLARQLRPEQIIYCSPLVDPYQPAEETERQMPGILTALLARPPRWFVLQTRGSLVLRDLDLWVELGRRGKLSVSFSITTDRDEVRRAYEAHCEPIEQRLRTIRTLREAGIRVHATLAPLLPCDPERLADLVAEATTTDVIGDPFHTRQNKRHGATTREQATRLSSARGWERWHDSEFQTETVELLKARLGTHGRRFEVGPRAFSRLISDE